MHVGMIHAYINSMNVRKIAIPVYRDRVAPLFDVAGTFLMAEVLNGQPDDIQKVEPVFNSHRQKISFLKSSGVDVVICSAISRQQAIVLLNNSIDIIPGVIGETGEILSAFCRGRLNMEQFSMPGCQWRKRHRRGRCPYYSELLKRKENE